MLNRAKLPDNVDELKALLSAPWAEVGALKVAHDCLLDEAVLLKLERDTIKLERKLFGQKSEKLNRQIDPLALELEALHITQGERIPAQ